MVSQVDDGAHLQVSIYIYKGLKMCRVALYKLPFFLRKEGAVLSLAWPGGIHFELPLSCSERHGSVFLILAASI